MSKQTNIEQKVQEIKKYFNSTKSFSTKYLRLKYKAKYLKKNMDLRVVFIPLG